MDKETLIRLATPASIFALAISIVTLPLTVKAYGDKVKIEGDITARVVGSPYDDLHVTIENTQLGIKTPLKPIDVRIDKSLPRY